ncbi:MAG TPA: hypothetical protein VGL81_09065 [Polyangiaceae bacterium]|jgi:hypothetical protein
MILSNPIACARLALTAASTTPEPRAELLYLAEARARMVDAHRQLEELGLLLVAREKALASRGQPREQVELLEGDAK